MTTVPRPIAPAHVPSGKSRGDARRVNFLFRKSTGTGHARLHRLILSYRTGREQPP
jgi:hypothetical protein